jgi:hypothetical protein
VQAPHGDLLSDEESKGQIDHVLLADLTSALAF